MFKCILFFYNYFLIPLAKILFPLMALLNPKLKELLFQQKNIWKRLEIKSQNLKKGPRVWFHVSSAGEFLQAKPVLESIKKLSPDIQILLTYVSPSAVKWVLNCADLDLVEFYPLDSKPNVQRLLMLLKPDVLVFVKFDLWPNLILESSKKNVPIILISATLTESSKRYSFSPARHFFKYIYEHLTQILTVSEKDAQLFRITNPNHKGIIVCGDTRTDSVLQRQAFFKSQSLSKEFLNLREKYSPILIAGSTWPADEALLAPAWKKFLENLPRTTTKAQDSHVKTPLLVLVPHEPTEKHLLHLEAQLNLFNLTHSRWSSLLTNTEVLIFNQVGGLAHLYRIADGAFVGAGKGGVHNTMEPAAWSLPVLFRNTYQNAPEAIELVQQNIFQVVKTSDQLFEKLQEILSNPQLQKKLGHSARLFFEKSQGAAEKSALHILQLLNFSNKPMSSYTEQTLK